MVCVMTTDAALDAVAQADSTDNETVDEAEEAPGRVSRIVQIVEREARPVTGAEEPKKNRDEEFEIETDLDEKQSKAGSEAQLPRGETQAVGAASAEEVIEVTDAELEPLPARSSQPSPTQPSPSQAFSSRPSPTQPSPADPHTRLQRSRPPERPSARHRGSFPPGSFPPGSFPPGSVVPPPPGSLPPPRSSSPGFPSPFASVPPSSEAGNIPSRSVASGGAAPGGVDPWLLANRTLELSRAHARIAELEEFIAFRDARIVALEDQLSEAQSKLRALEQRLGPRSESARSSPVAAEPKAAKPLDLNAAKPLDAIAAKPLEPKASKPLEPKAVELLGPKAAALANSVAKSATARQPVPAPSEPEKANEVTVVRPVTSPPAAPTPTVRSAEAAAPSAPVRPSNANAPAQPAAAVSAAQPAAAEIPAAAALVAPAEEASVDSELDDSNPAISESMPVESAQSQPVRGSSSGDDLRSIAGIGPRFEAALRKQGITRLAQIAAWSEDDVRQVAKALKIPRSRIVKGRWVESAREAIGTRAASD
jgi:NADH-quinone oxidoreductase subunit E